MRLKANIHAGEKNVTVQGKVLAFVINGQLVQIHGANLSCEDNTISLEINIDAAPPVTVNEEKVKNETIRAPRTEH